MSIADSLLEMPHDEAIKCLELAYKIGYYHYTHYPEAKKCIHLIVRKLQNSKRL